MAFRANPLFADNPDGSRRSFLCGMGASLAAAGCAAAAGWVFHNRNLVPVDHEVQTVDGFLKSGTEGCMCVARGIDGPALVRAALQELGGIERFVRPGDRVLLKANCAFDRPPHLGATTSPEVLGALVELCAGAGGKVRVFDNPINDPEGCFVKSGLMDAVGRAGGEVWLPNPRMFRRTQIGHLRIPSWEAAYEVLSWATCVIGVPTVKTHNLCGATLGLKNWYGLLDGPRSRLHQAIHEVIADLGLFIRPTLTVLDGTRLLIRNGPTGGSPADVVPGNVVAASTDPVAVDTFGVELLDVSLPDIRYLALAEDLGLGQRNYDKLNTFKTVMVDS